MTDEELDRLREAVAAIAVGRPERIVPLADLAAARAARFERSGDPAELETLVVELTEATVSTDWVGYLSGLGAGLTPGDATTAISEAAARIQHALTRAYTALSRVLAGQPDDSRHESVAAARQLLPEILHIRELVQTLATDLIYSLEEYRFDRPRGRRDAERSAPPPPPPPPPAPGAAPGYGGAPTGGLPPLGGRPQAPAPAPAPVPAAPSIQPPAPSLEPAKPAPRRAPDDDGRLEFTSAYRRVVERQRRYPVLFFVHRFDARDLVRQAIDRRAAQLGGSPTVAHGESSTAIAAGTTLTIVPNVLGATFEPAQIEVVTGDPVRELTFQLTVSRDVEPGALDGYIDIFVGPLVIAQVPVAFEVAEAGPAHSGAAELMEVANARVFDKIFISYSRKDSAVVDVCVGAYQSMGVEVLIDRLDLRSGEDWRAGLERMIRASDIFQLYWSTAAAASSEVANEWRLALDLSASRDRFIRPLYWETPIAPTPTALGHLHFSRFDVKALRKAIKGKRAGFLRRAFAALLPR